MIRECNAHTKITRTTGAMCKLNFVHAASDSWWNCWSFCSLRSYCCNLGPDLFPLQLVRTLLLTLMEKHWACNVYVLDLRLLREKRKDKAPPASELDCSARSCICTDSYARTAAGLCWCLGGITACCGKSREFSFFLFFFFMPEMLPEQKSC